MRVLRKGSKGSEVEAWQKFLGEEGFKVGLIDGDFGPQTEAATKAFQKLYLLVTDGIVGMQTLTRAYQLGFDPLDWPEDSAPPTSEKDRFWPPIPTSLQYLSPSRAEKLYGKFPWKPKAGAADRRAITILNDWPKDNLVTLEIPQLQRIKKPIKSGRITWHKKGAKSMQELWAAWEDAGLLHLIKTWDGGFNPRRIGNTNTLSNHSFGAAFDINAAWNPWGGNVPLVGQPGSIRLLVPLANQHGFFWGGHYKGKKDGMHFELTSPL